MSDLQIGLAVVGALAVLGVFAYNKIQERRYRREAEAVFRSERADVLLEPRRVADGGERIEPTVASEAAEPPAADAAAPAEPAPAAARAPEPAPVPFDERVDCLVSFDASEPLSAGSLWFAQHEVLGALEKRLRWFARDGAEGAWRQLDGRSAEQASRLLVALQLVDRNGPIGDAELDAFYAGMQQLADRFLAVIELPDRFRTRARAHELDSFAAAVDVQIGLNIVARRPEGFAGTKLRGLAEAAGFRLAGDGLFHAADEDGDTAFTLGNLEPALFVADELKALSTRGLTLMLDVPRTREGVPAFERMLRKARSLAESLDGALVDDNRAPLTDNALAFIRAKIAEFQAQMQAHGIPAGSDTARRLFG